jgi:FkbM family methyltransferase
MPELRDHAARIMDLLPSGAARRLHTNSKVTRLLRPLANALLPEDETVVTVRSGIGEGLRLAILPRTEKFYWTGLHEPHVQQALQRALRPGSVFWDVGAHIGFDSMIASRLVGPGGRVEAFEPLPLNQERLTRTIALNRCANITIHPQALAAGEGCQQFHLHGSSLMGSLVESATGGATLRTITVACTTIDAAAARLPRPDLIKIDAEGAEVDVLGGGRGLLTEHRPQLIVEFSSGRLLEEACHQFPSYRSTHLGNNHWLLRPDG